VLRFDKNSRPAYNSFLRRERRDVATRPALDHKFANLIKFTVSSQNFEISIFIFSNDRVHCILRDIGIEELIASDFDQYLRIAIS